MGRGVWWNTSSLLLETRVSLTLHQLQLCSRCFQVLSLLCFRFESNRCGCCFWLTCAAGIYFHSHLTLLLPPAYLTSFYLSIFSLISFLHLSSWREVMADCRRCSRRQLLQTDRSPFWSSCCHSNRLEITQGDVVMGRVLKCRETDSCQCGSTEITQRNVEGSVSFWSVTTATATF